MAYADIEDVIVDYGPVPDADVPRVMTLIERVEAQISQRVPDLDARITAGRTTLPLVRQVVAEVVATKLRNPEGYMQRSHTVTRGPYSESVAGTVAGGVAGGGGQATLTRRHLRLLGSPAGAASVPLADDALRRPIRTRGLTGAGEDLPEGVPYGNIWPDPLP